MWAPKIVDDPSPNFDAGPITPRGIVVHGTDSGLVRPVLDEMQSSADWLKNPAPGGDPSRAVSAHSLAGPGVLIRLVKPPRRAWHARTWNDHLGIELAHGLYTDAVDDQVLETGAWECAQWVRQYNIPLVWDINNGFAEHRAVPPGVQDGKVDVGPLFDHGDFIRRVEKYL